MYDIFQLKKAWSHAGKDPESKIAKAGKQDASHIEGYHWSLPDPDKVVCIVHGIGEYGGRYDRVAGRFNQKNYAVLSMDLRGHGHSVGPLGHCAPGTAVLDDISDLIRNAQRTYPGKPVILYGHSMGGNITLEYRSHGELNNVPAGYIITAPWIRLVQPIPGLAYQAIKRLSRVMPRFTVGSSVDEDILGNPEQVLPYHQNPMVHNKISLQCAVERYEAGFQLEDGTMEDNRRAADIPLLLMHGGDDRICDIQGTRMVASRLEALGDKLKYIEWPGLYHEIHNGGPESNGEEVIDEMIEFIGSCGR